jgi:hypothetical protein
LQAWRFLHFSSTNLFHNLVGPKQALFFGLKKNMTWFFVHLSPFPESSKSSEGDEKEKNNDVCRDGQSKRHPYSCNKVRICYILSDNLLF